MYRDTQDGKCCLMDGRSLRYYHRSSDNNHNNYDDDIITDIPMLKQNDFRLKDFFRIICLNVMFFLPKQSIFYHPLKFCNQVW